MTQDTWTPKRGDTVKYVARSTISGKIVNVQAMEVAKSTPAGYVYLTRRRDMKFARGKTRMDRYHEHTGKNAAFGVTSHAWIEEITPEEAQTLPRNDVEGSRYARELEAKG